MRVLCVSPRFAPVNAADSHRLRLLLPHLITQGCGVEVLAIEPSDVSGPQDQWFVDRLPPDLPVHRARAWALSGWGLNGLAQRSFVPLYRKGNELLASGRFDLVFFSTTEFLLHGLGPLWRRRWGVPFCMDFQDPWVNDYYRQNPQIVPPGGRLKYGAIDKLHRLVERAVVRRCSGFLSVSPAYLPVLEERYGAAVALQPRLVAGFPGEPAELAALVTRQPRENSADSFKTWRYIGRGGPDMAVAANAFFRAWRMALDRGLLKQQSVRFEAIGTSYAPEGSGAKTLEPLAEHAGLGGWVTETTDRLSYSDMLAALAESEALVVFGSDDPAYTASKIYPYLLAGRPLLAIFHRESTVVQLMNAVGGGVCVTFDSDTTPDALAQRIFAAWFIRTPLRARPALDHDAFEPFTAARQASQVSEWFRASIQSVEK